MSEDVKGKGKIVMFGKKTLVQAKEIETKPTQEKVEYKDSAGVMIGYIWCLANST